ncbi:MAG: N-acetylneuraminate synthase family protein [Bacteroidota bacterium]
MMKPVTIIAEIAQAHEGSLGIAHSYIDALAACGVDAVKFQTHIAKAESSSFEQFRIPFSYEDTSRFDYWKRMEFTPEQWAGIKQHCDDKGVEFMSSPFSVAAVSLLENIGVKKYKIGSGELTNYLMLDAIAKTGKPIILSSGMSDWKELDETLQFLRPYGNTLSIMQCTTAYPTTPEQWGLASMSKMKERYQLPVGFSDHSGDIIAPLAAVTLGAEIIEFHTVFDKAMFGPDAKSSLTINQIQQLVRGIRELTKAFGNDPGKENTTQFDELKILFGKSLALNKQLEAGYTLTLADLESKKPGDKGIPAKAYASVIGKKLRTGKQQWDFLQYDDLQQD